ncbi:MAG: phenylalanine-4-hydroxylase [Kiritimatiellia bacterium]|jgi:phenylalanine-4-hydroxylase
MSDRHLVTLDANHPGFRDLQYRERRDAIAHQALAHRTGDPVPDVVYTEAEQDVWRDVWEVLHPLHEAHVHPSLQRYQRELGLRNGSIAQFREVNGVLSVTDFCVEPVAGLVSPADFLHGLARGVFCATQYMRHASRPLYTPEPDVVHELVGHIAGLLHPELAMLNRRFGDAALRSDEPQLMRVLRVYWWTIEFGLVREGEQVYAVGAGLLSSAGELSGALKRPELMAWDLEGMAATSFEPSRQNEVLFVAPGWHVFIAELTRWLSQLPTTV